MSLRKILVITALASCAAVLSVTSEGAVVVDVAVAPPAPRMVVVPPPRAGYVWAPGYWRWSGQRYVWVDGRWVHERRGYRWVPEQWVAVGPRWHFVPGHWEH
jgi:hypothetical protein